jgi:hypothetical protein
MRLILIFDISAMPNYASSGHRSEGNSFEKRRNIEILSPSATEVESMSHCYVNHTGTCFATRPRWAIYLLPQAALQGELSLSSSIGDA